MKRFKAIQSANFIVLSYESLRSTTPRGLDLGGPRLLSHGLLYRKDPNVLGSLMDKSRKEMLNSGSIKLPSIPKALAPVSSPKALAPGSMEEKESKTEFFPSEELVSMVKEGCLFIFDEAQKIKNRNAQWLATRCIADTLLKYGGKSRF